MYGTQFQLIFSLIKKMKKILLLFLISANIVNIFAQDTIFWKTPRRYTSEDKNYKGYGSTALEIIKFSDDLYKLEECYYLENKRVVKRNRSETYNFTNDSTLIISYNKKRRAKYIYYKKDETTYKISQKSKDRIVFSGEVINLVPLVRHGKFTYYNTNGTITYYKTYKNDRYEKVEIPKKELDEVLLISEQMPEFPGGEVALRKFIAENLQYPKITQECDISGKVYVRFVVTKIGEVANIQIVRGVDELLDMEAIRVISTLPNFKPGMQNGKPVNVWYTVPVDFQLN